jgi:hypothetical protein
VASGLIQARPAKNTADQFTAELTGSREPGTSVWLSGTQVAAAGDADWAMRLNLLPGENIFEIWLVDAAGNRGSSEWVDIELHTPGGIHYEYNAAGRLQQVGEN